MGRDDGDHSTGGDRPPFGPPPGVPRWVRISLVVSAVLVVATLAVALLLGGPHGPGRHAAAASAHLADPRWRVPVAGGATAGLAVAVSGPDGWSSPPG
jgi:hypothetical protein